MSLPISTSHHKDPIKLRGTLDIYGSLIQSLSVRQDVWSNSKIIFRQLKTFFKEFRVLFRILIRTRWLNNYDFKKFQACGQDVGILSYSLLAGL